MTPHDGIRRAAVAGTFYPRDAGDLAHAVDSLLASVSPARSASATALMLPHAGYAYSGAVAAAGLRAADVTHVKTVVLIGPSHVESFGYSSVYNGAAYETPLGRVPIDAAIVRAVTDGGGSVRASSRGHVAPARTRGEHGLEVHLPFLQRMLAQFRIVPIVMGSQSWAACNDLGVRLRSTLDGNTLVLASSDLSHFHDAPTATRLDDAFCAGLTAGDPRALHAAVERGNAEACGAGPVVAALIAVAPHSARPPAIVARAHSGHVTGDHASVVGYAAAVIERAP